MLDSSGMDNVMRKVYKLAKLQAQASDHPKYRVGCVIFARGRIYGAGFNMRKTHPLSNTHNHLIHAELAAILSATTKTFKNCHVFVYMEKRNGTVGLAKPCACCEKLLKAYGFLGAYYTTSCNSIDFVRY